nr:histone-lysine N-methyltransferase 2D-like [Aedes albopictus]
MSKMEYDELDEDSLRFDALHTDACVLVETLLLSYPSTGNRTTQTPSPRSNRAPRRRTPRFRSRSPSRTSEQTVPNPDVVEKPSTSSLVEQLPSSFPPDETKLEQPVSDDTPKEKLPANDPANVKANGGLAEIINSESAPTPSKPPSVTPDVQKSHRTKKATLQEETPFSPKKQVTTVAHQESPAEESPIPTCEQHPPYPTKTSQKDRCLGNESFASAKSEIDVSPCEPSHASPDDDCAIADLKNETHRIPPPREEPVRDPMTDLIPNPTEKIAVPPKMSTIPMPAGFDAAQKPFRPHTTGFLPVPQPLLNKASFHPVPHQLRCATGSHPVLQFSCAVGSHPKLPDGLRITPTIKPSRTAPHVPPNPKRSLQHREIPPKKQPVPKFASSSPSTESAQASTGVHSVSKQFQIPAVASSVVDLPENFWTIADPQFDPPPICVYEHSHPDLKPKKPPDGEPKHHQPSEVIPACVSRTHPSRNPKEDAQYNHHLPTGPVCRPMPATMSHVYQETPKLATPPEDTVIRMPSAALSSSIGKAFRDPTFSVLSARVPRYGYVRRKHLSAAPVT